MLITDKIRQKLLEKGVSFLHPGQFTLPDHCLFEPPCSLKHVQVVHSLEMGAFSYAKSGYLFAARIGRYCSIEDNVQIGRGSHPVSWGSTSPVLYQNHVHVFNETIEEAKNFLINAKVPPAKVTVIGNDVYIGHGALISQGVTIGNGAIIRPMSVVTKDVPPFSIVEGNPCVVVGLRFPLEIASAITEISWWNYAFLEFYNTKIDDFAGFFDKISSLATSNAKLYDPPTIHLAAFMNAEEDM